MGSKNSKSILYEQACFSHKGMIKRTSILDPSLHYTFLKCLGEGSYSKVFLVQSKATGQLQALKKISKGSGHKADRHLINEFEILRQMVTMVKFRITQTSSRCFRCSKMTFIFTLSLSTWRVMTPYSFCTLRRRLAKRQLFLSFIKLCQQ